MFALFDLYEPLRELWFRADGGEISLAFPATAMVEAGERAGISSTAWGPLLWSTYDGLQSYAHMVLCSDMDIAEARSGDTVTRYSGTTDAPASGQIRPRTASPPHAWCRCDTVAGDLGA
jgi:hypothetical protein